jgi:hypothetical protein
MTMGCNVHLVYWRFIPKIQIDLWLKEDKYDVYDNYGLVIDVGWLCFSYNHFWEWGCGYEGPNGA